MRNEDCSGYFMGKTKTRRNHPSIRRITWTGIAGVITEAGLFILCLVIAGISQHRNQSSATGIAPDYGRFILGIVENLFIQPGTISHHDIIIGFGLATIISGLLWGIVFLIGIACYEILFNMLRMAGSKERSNNHSGYNH
jgi:hypothetical protein